MMHLPLTPPISAEEWRELGRESDDSNTGCHIGRALRFDDLADLAQKTDLADCASVNTGVSQLSPSRPAGSGIRYRSPAGSKLIAPGRAPSSSWPPWCPTMIAFATHRAEHRRRE